MTNRVARIKVRLKGTNVVRLIEPTPELNVTLMQHARVLAENTDIDGYLIAAWTKDGDINIGWRTGQIRGYLAAAMISNAVEAELELNHALARGERNDDDYA